MLVKFKYGTDCYLTIIKLSLQANYPITTMKIRSLSLIALVTLTLFSACNKKEAKKETPLQPVTVTKAIKKDAPTVG